jgi:hypothetical protein
MTPLQLWAGRGGKIVWWAVRIPHLSGMSISSFTEGRRYERPGKSKEPAGRRLYNSWENGEEKEAGAVVDVAAISVAPHRASATADCAPTKRRATLRVTDTRQLP